MYIWTYINIKAFKRGSLTLFLYIFLMYFKAEFDHSTLAIVFGITNNISKTLITLRNIFPICFSIMTKRVWDKDFGLSFSLAQYRFHSSNSCWKVDELRKSSLYYSNTSASSSALHCSKLVGMILTALTAEATLPWNLSLSCFLRNRN